MDKGVRRGRGSIGRIQSLFIIFAIDNKLQMNADKLKNQMLLRPS